MEVEEEEETKAEKMKIGWMEMRRKKIVGGG